MARIRSVKPEFFSDPKILDLRDGTALFFVALWTACDDAGYFETNSKSLSVKTARWRPQEVTKHLHRLHDDGLVRLSSRDGAGMVTNWSRHQRVMKPQCSKWEAKEIQWDNAPSPRNVPGRIGKDTERKGKEGDGYIQTAIMEKKGDAPTPFPTRTSDGGGDDDLFGRGRARKKKPPHPESGRTWRAFADAHFRRYGMEPIRNARVNTDLGKLCEYLGVEAPSVAAYYVTHNEPFYVNARHPTWMLVRDHQKLRTDLKLGEQMTPARAREVEREQGRAEQLGRIERGEV